MRKLIDLAKDLGYNSVADLARGIEMSPQLLSSYKGKRVRTGTVKALAKRLGLPSDVVQEILDYELAVRQLGKFKWTVESLEKLMLEVLSAAPRRNDKKKHSR